LILFYRYPTTFTTPKGFGRGTVSDFEKKSKGTLPTAVAYLFQALGRQQANIMLPEHLV